MIRVVPSNYDAQLQRFFGNRYLDRINGDGLVNFALSGHVVGGRARRQPTPIFLIFGWTKDSRPLIVSNSFTTTPVFTHGVIITVQRDE